MAGIVFQDDQFMVNLSKGYEDAAAEHGVEIRLANSTNDQGREVELINTYVGQNIDGIAIAQLAK